ncbi:hypothetical protein BELL_0098g00040 [Botrytis elliptica]|uniref:Uncharacterized protein n=1 Tax=Botrytis elliptica TaxID=278938 RepID=A0A4Z1JWQ0_9HELO|nr:hypothetical protein EAE99_002290 [Botrytis elliptica]TGO77614.1 hypothetical protein BELL_0098g00040 [Botrytis elliptica]
MEALAALSLAGNVMQFVDFSSKIISEARAIEKNGESSSIADLQRFALSSTKHARIIRSRLQASSYIRPLSEENQHLVDLAADCEQAGHEFAVYLSTFSTSRTARNFLHILKDTIRIRWRHEAIVAFVEKLESFQSALTLAAILAFQSNVDDRNDDIVLHMKELQKSSDKNSAESIRQNEQIKDTLMAMQSHSASNPVIQQKLQDCLGKLSSLHRSTPQNQTILKWLNFRQMAWRYEEICAAYQKTFQWIFRPPGPTDSWDDFGNYLSGEGIDAPYFINGKAGSGKSTLLRFIVDNEQTYNKLALWAPQNQLLALHFFFWNLGTPLQKSRTGMLRAILHEALSKHPELIPSTLPDIYSNWKDSYVNDEPTFVEMKRALQLFVEKASKFLKICIFIDGLDELAGDHKELAQFIHSFTGTNVKVVVSSRSINPSVNTFRGCPTLRLQDLTRHDMDQYIRGNLVDHQAMCQMSKFDPQGAGSLVSEIKLKAEGVFLWVRLVVRLLIDGLEAGDSIMDLQAKLQSLPRDLKNLYRRMLSRTLPEYQVQASEILQMFHVWNTYTSHQPLGVVTFAFAMQPLNEAFTRPVAPLNLDNYTWLYNCTEARIQSRCCGLLEIGRDCGPTNAALDWASGDDNDGSVVRYMHRTVGEFLVCGEVWEEMSEMTQNSGFNPALSLSSACLSMLKSASTITTARASRILFGNLINLLGSSFCFENRALPEYMQCMEHSMSKYQDLFSHLFGREVTRAENWLQYFRSNIRRAISDHNAEPFKIKGKISYKVSKLRRKAPPGAPFHRSQRGTHNFVTAFVSSTDNTVTQNEDLVLSGKGFWNAPSILESRQFSTSSHE